MKILIIGATGMAGQSLTQLAVAQGFSVTANGRNAEKLTQLQQQYPSITPLVDDAFNLTKSQLTQFDVVVDAFATSPDQAYLHVDLAAHLVACLRNQAKPRLAFILGAGSLKTGADQHNLVDDIVADPANRDWQAIPQNQLAELDFLKQVDNVNWFGISPGITFEDGPASDQMITGADNLLFNSTDQSLTTSGTMAQAMLSEIQHPKHHQTRFTIVNA
ncbi:NAD(P)-dependent oxidoreductase [Convivina praedatoris]|uniref:NAD(P)-binding domain-containing protein n=1 Tax=Convivina praedatoris TaxID=2880963 RepID=A0ABM9D2L2_9LACO|nr:NAD(P)H-binding protein [Convivina sp. LMG 32447]CAH1854441.1 hypothetical protein R077815_01045 [Convivina sp. LMG 32447]CAH1855657.1 hypothetical protein R078138_01180 [Convivina sp. LMG 32447]CAH1855765.1 hypothetical protein LMG032447_01159 [Convivina sp. LMG 32447]